jgi:Spy/CpxP family protein refolding chaperone
MDLNRMLSGALLIFLVASSIPVFGAEPDPFGGRLLPIEIVMAFRKEIDLTKAQSERIGKLVVDMQQGIAGKQWQMQSIYFDLLEALDQSTVDEQRTLELAKRAIDTENEIKIEQMRMLIRLRNMLTEQQVQFLRARLAEGWTKPA